MIRGDGLHKCSGRRAPLTEVKRRLRYPLNVSFSLQEKTTQSVSTLLCSQVLKEEIWDKKPAMHTCPAMENTLNCKFLQFPALVLL